MSESTPSSLPKLADFGSNRYFQFGEDGITQKIFELIGVTSKTCIEFGAWDGYHLSNTANLWTSGWKGILIEGDRSRYEILKQNTAGQDCVCINAYVGRDGPAALEAILERHGVFGEVDLLSINIDGDDYYVMDSLKRLRPRVIVCEYNPTMPAEADLYAAFGSSVGASACALCRLANARGYQLVAMTETNCLFVLGQYEAAFSAFETRLEHIKSNRHLAYLVTGYQGDYIVVGKPPYGLAVPYKGDIIGLTTRVRPMGTFAAVAYCSLRLTKQLVKRLWLARR